MVKTADWREMEAGSELDKAVVVAMGWRMQPDSDDSRFINLIFPDGTKWPLFQTEKPWDIIMLGNTLPHYSTDLNAAFMLFGSEMGLEWNLFSEDDDCITCELGYWREPEHADDTEYWTDKTAPLAIVKAWLQWQERTDHPAPEYPKGTENS